ncbi:MAG: tetratricopeptide repeat protein [Pseudomonadota bacterium]|nr:tetratricopeptide repeat protein [Pseudomonadota bacterium]
MLHLLALSLLILASPAHAKRPPKAAAAEVKVPEAKVPEAKAPAAGATPAPSDPAARAELVQDALARGDFAAAWPSVLVEADAGSAPYEFLACSLLFDGLGVAKDPAAAATWCQRSAEQGFPDAQWYLGEMYAAGMGVAADPALAIKWLRASSEQGDGRAQASLGATLFRGPDTGHAEAARWLDAAARQGAASAMGPLALILYGGTAVPQDKVLAYAWSHLGAQLDARQSVTSLRFMIAADVTPEEKLQAEAKMKELMAAFPR